MKASSIGDIVFDSVGTRTTGYCALGYGPKYGCNAWMATKTYTNESYTGTVDQDAKLNTYLNVTYRQTLSAEASQLIQTHTWSVGPVAYNNTDLPAQLEDEKSIRWNGDIAVISVSDYLKANTNSNKCGTLKSNNENVSTCKTTNYLQTVITNEFLWTIFPYQNCSHGSQYDI